MAPYTMSYDLIEVARSLCPRTNLHFLGQNLYFIGLAASQILDQNLTKKNCIVDFFNKGKSTAQAFNTFYGKIKPR